ncbi:MULTISPECIES: pore-forming ESAT-6 family protein [Cryobacterium]|nr:MULTISPECIES: pore-forming ESAT-6 family protein [Cryobacterium]
MGQGNQMDRRDYDVGASQNAQDNFNRVASQLESLLDQRDRDVNAAMSDYQADGVSDEYRAKEDRWKRAGAEVRTIISTLRKSLEQNDETAQSTLQKAKTAVDGIG